jgi:hypothetical protein
MNFLSHTIIMTNENHNTYSKNKLWDEGAANIAQVISTLENLTHLTLGIG